MGSVPVFSFRERQNYIKKEMLAYNKAITALDIRNREKQSPSLCIGSVKVEILCNSTYVNTADGLSNSGTMRKPL